MPIVNLPNDEFFLLLKNEQGFVEDDTREWMKKAAYIGRVKKHRDLGLNKGIITPQPGAVCVNLTQDTWWANIYDSRGLFRSVDYCLGRDGLYAGVGDVVSRLRRLDRRSTSEDDSGIEHYVATYLASFGEYISRGRGVKPKAVKTELPLSSIKRLSQIPSRYGTFLVLPRKCLEEGVVYMGELDISEGNCRHFSESEVEGVIQSKHGFMFRVEIHPDRANLYARKSTRGYSETRLPINLNHDRVFFSKKAIRASIEMMTDRLCNPDSRDYVAKYLIDFSEKSIIAR